LLNATQYPAMVLNSYGAGHTALVGFDPSAFVDAQGAVDALANVIHYATSSIDVMLPGAIAEIRWTASNLIPPLVVEIKAHLVEGLTFISAPEGTILGEREAVWERNVFSEESVFSSLVKLPAVKGDYAVTTELFDKQSAPITLLNDNVFVISLVNNRDDLGMQLLNELNTLKVTAKNRARLQTAIMYVKKATGRVQQTRDDAGYSINDLLSAFELITQIDSVTPQMMASHGRLLGAYQLLWSSFSNKMIQ